MAKAAIIGKPVTMPTLEIKPQLPLEFPRCYKPAKNRFCDVNHHAITSFRAFGASAILALSSVGSMFPWHSCILFTRAGASLMPSPTGTTSGKLQLFDFLQLIFRATCLPKTFLKFNSFATAVPCRVVTSHHSAAIPSFLPKLYSLSLLFLWHSSHSFCHRFAPTCSAIPTACIVPFVPCHFPVST